MTIARRLRIHGWVQGVGYRESMRREADRLGVCGWVRNRRDGTVEALACGPEDAVLALITWAHAGPRFSQVERMQIEEETVAAMAGFAVIPTE
jgi:acylphosphatase